MAMTNGQRTTLGFAPSNTVISTGQRATFGFAYTLDGVGNKTRTDLNEPMMPSYNAETVNYTYTLGNILASAAEGGPLANGNTYTHDANGNRTSKTSGTNVTSYTYDSLNRLTQTSTSTRQIQYLYNGLGQRVGRIDNGVQTNYLVDPNGILPQVMAETDASNNLITFYVYDGAGLVAKITPQNQYYFYHYDGLGSTIAITDNAGQVVNTYCYSPEGLVGVQETIPNPFTYVGRYGVMAEGNGLYYMRARYYDPEVGRFINKDPIGYAGGMNLFGYVRNNPVNLRDPYGLLWIYHSSTGVWEHLNDQTGVITYEGRGYAGIGAGLYNPAMQNIDSVGPLPQNYYTIGPQQNITTNNGTRLQAAMELIPDTEENMFGRPGRWFFHGDNEYLNYTASEGCPVGTRTLRDRVGSSGDRRLLVVP